MTCLLTYSAQQRHCEPRATPAGSREQAGPDPDRSIAATHRSKQLCTFSSDLVMAHRSQANQEQASNRVHSTNVASLLAQRSLGLVWQQPRLNPDVQAPSNTSQLSELLEKYKVL